jgi:hypothetical protein
MPRPFLYLGCCQQTVRHTIHEFNEPELDALKASSWRHRALRFHQGRRDLKPNLAFTARLREETDLNALTDEVTSMVRGTMQPAPVSLWLRPDPEPEAKSAALE